MLANKLEIRRLLEEDWKYDPTALATCLAIFDYLSTNDISQVRHISFVSLKTITNANDLPTLIKAINYLSGARLPLLDTNFEFIDEITDVIVNSDKKLSKSNIEETQLKIKKLAYFITKFLFGND